MPRAQRDLIAQQCPGGVSAFVQDKLRWLMTEVPAAENYFWRLYLHGSYTRQCCPNYLREENLATLRERAWRVRLHTRGFADFLAAHEDRLTHFVLLDHQDWLWAHDREALEQEWRMILAKSAPGAAKPAKDAKEGKDKEPSQAEALRDFGGVRYKLRTDRKSVV